MLFKLVGIPTYILGGYQSGQMGWAVNPLTSVSKVRIFPPPNLKFNDKERDRFGYCGCSSMVER